MCTWTSTYFEPRLGIRFRMVGSQIFVPTSVSNGLGPKPSTERHLPWVEWHWFIGAAVVSRCESSKRKGGETREKVISKKNHEKSRFGDGNWPPKFTEWKLKYKVCGAVLGIVVCFKFQSSWRRQNCSIFHGWHRAVWLLSKSPVCRLQTQGFLTN